ncbi:MAG: VCBS repeat-containing protein [Bacteroidetes bacterium]|nr:VCBS repeat-containing protein [Bacteroidota bacterium]
MPTYLKSLLILPLIAFLSSCSNNTSQSNDDAETGKELANQYCKSCHQLPLPNQLTKELWRDHVLPQMGYFMGIYPNDTFRQSLLKDLDGGERLKQAGIYPEQALISKDDFAKISAYFIKEAPEKFEIPTHPRRKATALFTSLYPNNTFSPPSTTLIRFNSNGGLFFGDAHTKQFLELKSDRSIKIAAELEEGAVCAEVSDDFVYVTVMGSFSPTDAALGMLVKLPLKGNDGAELVLDQLQRPVHSAIADFNQDGYKDFVVSEFGKFTGGLNIYFGSSDGKYTKQTLWQKPGAVKTYVKDMNKDGLPDIVALFAQADEGIDIYYNKGKNQFERNRVLSFPPGYGSSAFHLIDFDQDGDDDIIYTGGDNADFKNIPRPYHGIYMFKNDGKNQFEQSFFYYLNGAYDARLIDFDQDGDLDLAAISFFPDFAKQIDDGFVYLENQGNFQFTPNTFDGVENGRWILMDTKDYDQDGDEDIVLGSLVMQIAQDNGLVDRWINAGIPFVILENRLK